MASPMQGRILDMVKGSAATVALFLAFIFLPLFGIVPGIFAPAPAVYYSLKSGRLTGLAVVAITSALLAAVSDPAALLIYLLQAGVMSLALPEFLSRHKGGARSVVYSVAITLVVIAVAAIGYGVVTGSDLHAKVMKGVATSINQTSYYYQKAGITGDELKGLQGSMRQAGALIVTIYPALVTVSLGMIASLNILLVSRVAAKRQLPLYLGEFRKYRNPEPLVWLLIVAGFAMLFNSKAVYLPALNVLVVLVCIYMVQGLAVISHFVKKFAVPMYVKAFFILLLILQPFLVLAVAVLGVFDLWGDFRSHDNKQANL